MASLSAMARDAKKNKKVTITKKATKSAPPTNFKSAEFIAAGDEENEQSSSKESSSDNESLPENLTDALPKVNGKLPAPSGSSSSSSSSSESNGDKSSSSDDSDEESSDALAKPPAHAIKPTKTLTKQPSSKAASVQTTPLFQPPAGFEIAKLSGNSKTSDLFKKSNLHGKEVWYITAPAFIPISSIERMSLLDTKNGNPVLNYKNNDYGFMQDSMEDKTYSKIMVPRISDEGYQLASNPIDRMLRLQQIVSLPGVHGSTANAEPSSKATIPAKKPVRQQPKGLKMRYRPIGFGNGETGGIGSSEDEDSYVDMEDAPRFRKAVGAVSSGDDSDEGQMAKPLKKKTSKKDSHPIKQGLSQESSSQKRKRKEEGGKKSKHSSSNSTGTIDENNLKRMKKKQKLSQNTTEDNP